MKRPASCTRLQICNLPPLELPTAVDNFVYVRIINIEGDKLVFRLSKIAITKVN